MKMAITLNKICWFNAIHIRIPKQLFTEIKKTQNTNLKFHMETEKIQDF